MVRNICIWNNDVDRIKMKQDNKAKEKAYHWWKKEMGFQSDNVINRTMFERHGKLIDIALKEQEKEHNKRQLEIQEKFLIQEEKILKQQELLFRRIIKKAPIHNMTKTQILDELNEVLK